MQSKHQSIHKTSRPEIDSLDQFQEEFTSLLENFDADIANLAQYERTEMHGPSVQLVERLNKLKLHRKKVKDMLALAEAGLTENAWVLLRPQAQEVFEKALHVRRETSDEIAS